MKRKSILVCIFILLTFVLISCTNSKDVYVISNEFFENKLLLLKEGEAYKINYEDILNNKFSYEIEEYNYILGSCREEEGADILFEDERLDPNFKLYGDSECLELSNDVITAKGLGRVTVNILIKMKRYSSNSWRELLCCPILEVVVTDAYYSNFKRINNGEDFAGLQDSSNLFLLNHSLDLKGSKEGINFSGVLINPYNYSIDLTLDEDHERLFMNLKYAVIDNIKISHLQVFFQRGIRNLDLFSYKVKNSCLSNILIQEIIVQSEDSNQIVFCDSCECSTFSNIEIHTSEQLKTNRFYVFGSIQSSVFIKNLIFLNYSQTIGMCGIAFMVESTVANSTYALPYERKNEDAFEVYNILFINKSSHEKIECGFQYFNVISQYPFGKDKVFYSVGFNATDDLFINKTIEEVTSGESLFTSGEFKFEKGKLPTLFY